MLAYDQDTVSVYDMLRTDNIYFNRLVELCISMFKWDGLPDTVDERFLELALTLGNCLFFRDDVLGYLALRSANAGELNVYGIPTRRQVIAPNGYNAERTISDSVIIYNNYTHTSPLPIIDAYAKRLMQISLAIDVNANAQKTPILIQCDEKQRMTLLNLYRKYEGNEPVIFGNKNLDLSTITVIKTDAPYVADKLNALKREIWNEALQYLGLLSVSTVERERQNQLESGQNSSAAIAARYSKLLARRQACDQINRMFGLDVHCDYNHDIDLAAMQALHNLEGDDVANLLKPDGDLMEDKEVDGDE